jgi:hypothetical protein
MPLTAALIGGSVAAPIVGGIIGNAVSSGDRQQALDLQKQALANIMGVSTPDIEKMQLALQQYQLAGQVNPEMEQIIKQDPSLLANIQVDPRLRQAQMGALSKLQSMGVSGLRPEDQAALAKVMNNVNQQEQANEQSILQNMQQRGIGGSGAELAAKLNSAQASANRASEQGLDIAGQASQRALQAIMQAGSLGGQMEGQQFGEEAQKASAQDIINRYNAQNAQQVANTNINAKNLAQAQNLQNQQAILNANAQLANQQQQYNKGLAQQNYQNQLNKAQVAAGQSGNLSNAYNQQAANTQKMYSGIGQGVGQGLSSAAYMNALSGKAGTTKPAPPEQLASNDIYSV